MRFGDAPTIGLLAHCSSRPHAETNLILTQELKIFSSITFNPAERSITLNSAFLTQITLNPVVKKMA